MRSLHFVGYQQGRKVIFYDVLLLFFLIKKVTKKSRTKDIQHFRSAAMWSICAKKKAKLSKTQYL
jgi:hypothetical protein